MIQTLTRCRRWSTCPSTDTCAGSSCPWWSLAPLCCSCCGFPSGWSKWCCPPFCRTTSCSTGNQDTWRHWRSHTATCSSASYRKSTFLFKNRRWSNINCSFMILDVEQGQEAFDVTWSRRDTRSWPVFVCLSVTPPSASCRWSCCCFRSCFLLFWNKDTHVSGSKAWSEPGRSALVIYCRSNVRRTQTCCYWLASRALITRSWFHCSCSQRPSFLPPGRAGR